MKRSTIIYIYCCLLSVALVWTSGCELNKKEAEPEKKEAAAIPAHVVPTISRKIIDYAELTGRTAAVESVDVRAQVSGYLATIDFQPGTLVKKDDVLFTLDSRVYAASKAQAESAVAAKQAELKQLEADLARQELLLTKNATSQQQFELATAERDKCAADLAAANANLDRAKIDLDYATIKSPIEGEVSREQITVGNLVTSGSTVLTHVVAVDPIHVFFDVDERSLLRFREQTQTLDPNAEFRVRFAIGDGEFSREAVVDFSEPRLNDTTGTLEFRAVAENKPNENGRRDLIPGLRLRVLFPTSLEYEAVLVPEEAIVTDQNVKRVYVVGDDNKVISKAVKLGPLQEDNMRVVLEGLELGERVVVDNLLRIRADSTIEPLEAEPESTTRIVREDGTIVNNDGTIEYDGVYEWSLERDAANNGEDAEEENASENATESTT